jgi:protein TonB
MHTLRFPFAAISGLFIALAVFSVLSGLVSKPIKLGEIVTPRRIEFTRKIIENPVEPKHPQKIVRPPPPIVPPGQPIDVGVNTGDNVVTIQRTDVSIRIDHGHSLPIGQDRDVMPIVRVPPEYPPREAARGIEGWVKVQFSITAIGTVRDAIVVDAEPKGSFDDAALKAIARWRYNPKIEGGVPVERVGLQTVIRFQLEQ